MQRRLGRGLAALLSTPKEEGSFQDLPLDRILPNPFQPREAADPAELEELVASIRIHGVLQPIAVRRAGAKFELIAGERRWRASRQAGRTSIPAVVREDVSNQEMLELALVENLQRRDLNPIEKAFGYQRLGAELGLTQAQIAERVGVQRPTVANQIRLLELPEPVRKALAHELLTTGHARALLGLASSDARIRMMEETVRQGLSVRDVERRVKGLQRGGARSAPGSPSAQPAWVRETEDRLRASLGTKVAVRPGPGARGQIWIDYADTADLNRLLEQLAPRPTL